MSVNLGEAFYKLTIDDNDLTGGLDAARSKVKRTATDIEKSLEGTGGSFKKLGRSIKEGVTDQLSDLSNQVPVLGGGLSSLGVAGGVAAGAFVALGAALTQAYQAMQFADELDAISNKIGVSAEYLQKMQFAAGEADVSVSAFNSGLEKLNSSLGAFKSGVGDGRVLEAFKELGIDQSQIASMNDASDLLPLIAERLAMVGSKAEQVQLAKKLGIEELLPLLLLGKDRINALGNEAERLGLVLDNYTTASLAEMSREVEIASQRIDINLKRSFLGLAPVLVGTSNLIADLIQGINKFAADYNRAMNVTAFQNRGATRSQAEARADLLTDGAGPLRTKGGRGANMFSGSLQPVQVVAPRPASTSGSASRSRSLYSPSRSREAPKKEPYQKMGWEIKDDQWMMNPTSLPGVVQLENDIIRMEELIGRLPQITNPLKDAAFEIGDSFAYAMGQAAAGVGDFGDIFEQEMRRMVANWVSSGVQDIIAQLLNGQNGKGGIINNVLSFLGFGGFRAMGGSVSGGRAYVVGENGPEMFVPAGSGSIVPNHKLSGSAGAVYQTFDLRGAMVDKDVWAEVDRRAKMAARQSASVAYRAAVSESGKQAPSNVQRAELLEG